MFPGIAVAEEVLTRRKGNDVLFVGTQQGIEGRILPELGYPHRFIKVRGIKGASMSSKLGRAMLLPGALWESVAIAREFGPDIAIGVGGYASGLRWLPRACSASRSRCSSRTASPGSRTVVLSRFSNAVFTTFASNESY
ncbi:MAG: UDP-N-acetylglucosamine--N-acetylmuramyl-(pentapeptide) pyrophosphoryl-undecaprenol N-acetylglucosamine transferase, partial [Myxococcales bacterium]|nr:UDP-N-acetylglucosamine--N-acetylmuramyl-(pentapeptide) pyrophosphoryl-undecaprenol N-acetylglucosamine transferase [Myxococcales bacterium]